MQVASRFIGFTAIRCRFGLFPSLRSATVLAVLPSLAKVSLCESSFRSATPPRSSFTSINAARRSFDASCAYPGFWPSSRHHQLASTHVEISQIPTMFRPQALSASRRFSPQVDLQAYFIPQPYSGPILFRGSFSPRSRTISSIAELFPPCR
jgi:hypothetical protein